MKSIPMSEFVKKKPVKAPSPLPRQVDINSALVFHRCKIVEPINEELPLPKEE